MTNGDSADKPVVRMPLFWLISIGSLFLFTVLNGLALYELLTWQPAIIAMVLGLDVFALKISRYLSEYRAVTKEFHLGVSSGILIAVVVSGTFITICTQRVSMPEGANRSIAILLHPAIGSSRGLHSCSQMVPTIRP